MEKEQKIKILEEAIADIDEEIISKKFVRSSLNAQLSILKLRGGDK